MTFRSTKHLVTLALMTTIALTIFILEAQIPVPVPIPGVKLGLANIITLIALVKFRARDALAVLLMRIFLGSLFTGMLVSFFYSLCGGLLCFAGMAILCRIMNQRYLWFISIIGAVLHNIGQIGAATLVMQTTNIIAYLPFLMVTGCVSGLFTGLAAQRIAAHWNICKTAFSSQKG